MPRVGRAGVVFDGSWWDWQAGWGGGAKLEGRGESGLEESAGNIGALEIPIIFLHLLEKILIVSVNF